VPRTKSVALSVLLFYSSASISPTYAQAPEIIAGGASLTGLISGLKGLAKQIEDSGHSLIEHGNAALGQQQVLMASTLNATISQFEQAYKSSLTLTFDEVDVQTQNAYKELDKTVKNADKIRTRRSRETGFEETSRPRSGLFGSWCGRFLLLHEC
jgi:hypothetical protein